MVLGLLAVPLVMVRGGDEPSGKGKEGVKEPAAAELLDGGLSQAGKEGRRVFLVFGSPGCGWCKRFDQFHDDPEVGRVVGKHLVLVKVDVVKNPGGEALYLKHGRQRGVPAWTILDPAAKVLADSGDAEKNVGFPFQPNEVEHYVKALRASCPGLTDAEVDLLTKKLKEVSPKL
jgi:hypothetical protein